MSGFATTRWSLIVQARDDDASGRDALDQLCRHYRDPVAAYIRHHSARAQDVEDLVQAFFLHFLERELHVRANPLRGSFRPFLLTALRNFLRSETATTTTAKRGGGQAALELNELDFSTYDHFTAEEKGPESAFNRTWALTVLNRALNGLSEECSQAGKSALFTALQPCLVEPPDTGEYARLGAALNMSPNTVAVAVKRLRMRLRERIRSELTQTVADGEALSAELAILRDVL
jgi:RNA polymerase sigma-70 factor (ECF subfamily)